MMIFNSFTVTNDLITILARAMTEQPLRFLAKRPLHDYEVKPETWTHDHEFFFLVLNLATFFKDSTQGKNAHIWQI